jgi:hypothetical protein
MRRLRARAILRAKSAADQLSYRSADPVPHRTSPLPPAAQTTASRPDHRRSHQGRNHTDRQPGAASQYTAR